MMLEDGWLEPKEYDILDIEDDSVRAIVDKLLEFEESLSDGYLYYIPFLILKGGVDLEDYDADSRRILFLEHVAKEILETATAVRG
jgi:hypothetical protein